MFQTKNLHPKHTGSGGKVAPQAHEPDNDSFMTHTHFCHLKMIHILKLWRVGLLAIIREADGVKLQPIVYVWRQLVKGKLRRRIGFFSHYLNVFHYFPISVHLLI